MRVFAFMLLLMLSTAAFAETKASPATGETMTVDEAVFSKPLDAWFQPNLCAQNPGGNIFVSLASSNTVLKIPRQLFDRAMPKSFDMSQDDSGRVMIKIAKTGGCPETPFNTARLLLHPPQGVDTSGLLITVSPGLHDGELTKLRDSGTCAEEATDFLKCSGRQTISGTPQHIDYYMSKKELQKSGGPLRARCQYVHEKPFCLITDKVTNDTSFEVVLKAAPTLENIRALHDAAETAVESFKP